MPEFDPRSYAYPSRRNVVYARKAMACTSIPQGAQIGLDVMKAGGNAVDAAVAMAAAMPLLEPTSNGLGSDCFALVWVEAEKKLYGLNASGVAPAALSAALVRELGHQTMPQAGWIPTMVPGAPAGWAELNRRFGTKPLPQLFAPAISAAREGVPVQVNLEPMWEEDARRIAAVSLAGGLLSALLFSAVFRLLADPVLHLCGATEATYAAAYGYAKWVVILGGPFTILNTLLANLVRAEGGAGAAAFGVSFGGVLNILLDPLFVLPQFLGLGAVGAGMATALSNGAAVACFAVYLVRRRGATYLNLLPANLRYAAQYLRPILAIGFPSALQYALTVVATAAQADFVSQYPTEAVAALGIVKKLDQLPLYFSIGVSNGLLPLLAYNHAAGNHHRRAQAFRIGSLMSFGFAVLCLVCYEAFATPLVSLFIADAATVRYGAVFLRCMVTAMPMMALCYPMIIQFQAMGRARETVSPCVHSLSSRT